MSFILDALRKSEHARQRTTGPGFAEAPVAAPKPKTNVWATAAVALLVINLVAVGVLLLRRASRDEAVSHVAADAAVNPQAAGASTSNIAPTSFDDSSARDEAEATAAASNSVPAFPREDSVDAESRRAPVAAPAGRNPLADELGGGASEAYVEPELEPSLARSAAAVPAGPPAVSRQAPASRRGSVVYAPVPEAADLPYAPPPEGPSAEAAARADAPPMVASTKPPATRGESLPGADEMTARGVPALHLDLHVYSSSPQQRFVFVNSRKYREGDTLQEGPVIERITQDGAVLNFQGSRFKLSSD